MNVDPKILEALMLVCFGSSWPFAVVKTFRTKTVEGKSFIFLCLIFTGYVAGIGYKMTSNLDSVIWIYFLNASLVFTEIVLYLKYETKYILLKDLRNRWSSFSRPFRLCFSFMSQGQEKTENSHLNSQIPPLKRVA